MSNKNQESERPRHHSKLGGSQLFLACGVVSQREKSLHIIAKLFDVHLWGHK